MKISENYQTIDERRLRIDENRWTFLKIDENRLKIDENLLNI